MKQFRLDYLEQDMTPTQRVVFRAVFIATFLGVTVFATIESDILNEDIDTTGSPLKDFLLMAWITLCIAMFLAMFALVALAVAFVIVWIMKGFNPRDANDNN